MSNDDEFVNRFLELQRETGYRRALTPTEAVGAWEHVVENVRESYHMGIDEYRNDLFHRARLGLVLHDEQLVEMPQMARVREQVERIDTIFKELLAPEPLPHWQPDDKWWKTHPPRYAGPELAEDLHAQYGIQIEVRET